MHLLRLCLDKAILWLERARRTHSFIPHIHASLAAAYALNDQSGQASAALAEARKLSDRYSSITHLKAAPDILASPKLRALAEPTYFAGLRLAGMPEE